MKIKIINSLAAAALLTGSLGVLQAEKAKSTDAKPAKAKAAKKSDRSSQRAAFIKRFDKDGDGKLNEVERKAAGAARKAQGARQSDRVSDKARPNSGGREGYAAAAKRIKEAVKAGKITEAQGKERLAADSKRMGEGRVESDKARPNSGGRERYAAAAIKIKESVNAGKITEAQGKERLAALRKRLGEGRGDSGRSRQTREELMKRYDKNKDGKLDEDERAALRKAMSGSSISSRGKDRSSGQDKNAERKRRGQGGNKNAERKRRGQGGNKTAERKRRGGEQGKRGDGKRRGGK